MLTPETTETVHYWFNFIWLIAYFLVLIGMSGYGFHRLMMVVLYIIHRKDIPQPKGQWEEWPLVTIQLLGLKGKLMRHRAIPGKGKVSVPCEDCVIYYD